MEEESFTATERLRAMLDERGVEWRRTPHYSSESQDNETIFEGNGIEWYANDHLNGRLGLRTARYEVTPEQAIEATLGSGVDAMTDAELAEHGLCRIGSAAMWDELRDTKDRELSEEHGLVRLPTDADGEYIHIGDVMDKGRVTCIRDCGKGWEVILDSLYTFDTSILHHHTPTVEDVLREFTDEVWNRCCEGATASDSGIDELVAECAAKLRLAGDAE